MQPDDPLDWWEEEFRGYVDHNKDGPQAISMDLFFPGFSEVYGVPQHASDFALKDTTGSSHLLTNLSQLRTQKVCVEKYSAGYS